MNKQHRSNIVQTDALYKLNLLGYPVLVARFSDANKRFHPTVIGICSSEASSPMRVFLTPSTRRIVWPNSDDQRCFFHVIMNLKKELPKLAAYSFAVAEIQ
uniref:MULE transposase domain-containing protein n=1 Tax=Ditylenchus dipsaci TaxID=166011 RepID=A0A915ESR6_9BILA